MSLELGLELLAAENFMGLSTLVLSAITLAMVVVPYLLGGVIAKSMRMNDYGWKIGIILASLCLSGWVVTTGFPPKLGVDLKGGSILVYEIDREKTMANRSPGDSGQIDMGSLIQILSNRINPSGTKEIVVRPYGDSQIEIIIPDADDVEIDRIKKSIRTAGELQFRIVANQFDHSYIITTAQAQANDPASRRASIVTDTDGSRIGRWVRVGRDTKVQDGFKKFKIQGVSGDIIRNAATGELIQAAVHSSPGDPVAFERWLASQNINEIDVLMATNDGLDVTGDYLGSVYASYDEAMKPCVAFTMKGAGAQQFGLLTGQNLPEKNTQRYKRLGIVLDNSLLSAPQIISTISDQGRITGSFSQEDVDFLVGVLNAGSLPATLQTEPISENRIGSLLGKATIERGKLAIMISIGCVLVFILIYYRLAGVVA